MNKRYRSVLLGLGNIAWKMDKNTASGESLSHAAAYVKNPMTELVAGYSPDGEDMALFQQKYGLPVYDDIGNMLDEQKPDIVSVCSPTAFHFEQMKKILSKSIPMVWLEKPPAESAEQVQQLISTNRDGESSTILVNYQRRYTESYRQLQHIIHNNQFGDTKQIEIRYSKGLAVNGIHMMDLVFYIFGNELYELLWVENENNTLNPSFMMRFKSGINVLVNGCDLSYHNIDIIVTCEHARLSILHGGMTTRHEQKVEHELFPGFYRLSDVNECILGKGGFDFSYDKALLDLIASYQGGYEPHSNLETSYRTQELVDKVFKRDFQ